MSEVQAIVCDLFQANAPSELSKDSSVCTDTNTITSLTGSALHQLGITSNIVHEANPEMFTAEDQQYDSISTAKLFHCNCVPSMHTLYENNGEKLISLFEAVKEFDLTTSLDTAMPDLKAAVEPVNWRAIFQELLPKIDIFIPGFEELVFMLDPERHQSMTLQAREENVSFKSLVNIELLRELCDELLEMDVAVTGAKLGAQGLFVKTGHNLFHFQNFGKGAPADAMTWLDQELFTPCFNINAAGASGAGDSAFAGFLAGMLKGQSLSECVVTASAVGACYCESSDPHQGLPSWQMIESRLQADWQRRDSNLDLSDFHWQENPGVWVCDH